MLIFSQKFKLQQLYHSVLQHTHCTASRFCERTEEYSSILFWIQTNKQTNTHTNFTLLTRFSCTLFASRAIAYRDNADFQAKVQAAAAIPQCEAMLQHTAPPLDFVKELRDPHCRCNLRAIVSQELLFNLEPFKKVGRRHNKQASTQVNVCFKRHCLPQLYCSYIARQPYSMLSSLALTQLP